MNLQTKSASKFLLPVLILVVLFFLFLFLGILVVGFIRNQKQKTDFKNKLSPELPSGMVVMSKNENFVYIRGKFEGVRKNKTNDLIIVSNDSETNKPYKLSIPLILRDKWEIIGEDYSLVIKVGDKNLDLTSRAFTEEITPLGGRNVEIVCDLSLSNPSRNAWVPISIIFE